MLKDLKKKIQHNNITFFHNKQTLSYSVLLYKNENEMKVEKIKW